MSVDFLAPAAKGSGSQAPYSDYRGLRKLLGDGLMRGQLPGRPQEPGVMRAGGDSWKEAPLMRLIDEYESKAHGGYSAVNSGGSAGGKVPRGSRSDPSIQGKSIRQLIGSKEYHAMGRYQFLGSTLQDIFQRLGPKLPRGLTVDSKFTPQVQDQLFLVYLQDTGFNPSRLAGRWIGLGRVDPGILLNAAQDFQRRFAR
jgi:muramidase (phage lysozyme)